MAQSNSQNYSFIVRPGHPLPVGDLDIMVSKGQPSDLSVQHPELYREVLSYWNDAQMNMVKALSGQLQEALNQGDEAKVARLMRHVSGVSAKCGLSRAHLDSKTLYLAVSLTNYMEVIGTNERAVNDREFRDRMMLAGMQDHADPDHYFANPLSVCSVVYGFTKDDRSDLYVAVGLRSDKVMIYPNTYHVIGGLVDVSDDLKRVDLGGHMQKELMQEMGLSSDEMSPPVFYGMVRQAYSRLPEAVCGIRVHLDKDSLSRRWSESAPGKFEHRNISFYDAAELKGFVEQNRDKMVPSGEAALDCLIEDMQL